jgi:oxygen-independent coproporphyrinogen-3 oxidase
MYKRLGVNRISMGLQSIHENELKILGRIHSFNDFLKSYELCYRHGIENLNLDLMYGIPSQTPVSFRKTLDTIAAIAPKHISAYGLILEEGTRFFEIRDSLQFPSEEEEFEMYRMASDILSGKGYSHYEISNYAKEGFECKHNLKYWHDEQYIGFGLSAHSYFNGKRYSNHVEFSEYFSPQREQYISEQILTVDDQAYEYAMLRLRLSEGFSLSEYERKFSRSFLKGKEKFVDSLISLGYVTVFGDRIALTESGFYVSNSILSELL